LKGNGAEQPAAGGLIAYPLLIECDSRGRVLWMSERTHLALSEAHNAHLLETVEPENVRGRLLVSHFKFWRVLDMGDRTLISAQSPEPAASVALREVSEMLRLETRMLRHYFRLQTAEQAIAGHARKKRSGVNQAVRLIEMERQRIARELHTGVGQMLAAIRLQLEIVAVHFPNPPDPVRLALDHIGELADGALQQVRSVSQRLHPPEWQRLSLPAALQQLWELSGIPQKFAGSIRLEVAPGEPDLQVKVLLYRAAQEALSNLLRHSQATRVDVLLEMKADQLVLTIADNGVGFDAAAAESGPPNLASGTGLRSIRELAEDLGGSFGIESGVLGTKLVVSVPGYLTRQ
jgi:signal transduction histidine kinase